MASHGQTLSHNQGAGFPKIEAPLVELPSGRIARPWLQLLIALWQTSQRGGNPIQVLTPGSSPFTVTATASGMLLVSGGTVQSIYYTRDGGTLYNTGATSGPIPVSIGDMVKFTYTIAPQIVLVPQ